MTLKVARGYAGVPVPAAPVARERGFAESFDRLLDRTSPAPAARADDPVRFSRHALARLQSRGVDLDAAERRGLSDAIDQLAARGARESLVLLGDHAFVVGVPNRTVITAMPRADALGTVFTNIDSTFVASGFVPR